jgi:hypothetical protein
MAGNINWAEDNVSDFNCREFVVVNSGRICQKKLPIKRNVVLDELDFLLRVAFRGSWPLGATRTNLFLITCLRDFPALFPKPLDVQLLQAVKHHLKQCNRCSDESQILSRTYAFIRPRLPQQCGSKLVAKCPLPNDSERSISTWRKQLQIDGQRGSFWSSELYKNSASLRGEFPIFPNFS